MQKMMTLLHTSVAKILLLSILLLTIPALIFGVVYQRNAIEVMKNELASSHCNALRLVGSQLSDRLSTMKRQASALLLDDDLIDISNQSSASLDLYDLAMFQRKASLYRATNFIDNDLTIFFPRHRWMISTQHGVQHMPQWEQPASTGQWEILPSLYEDEGLCLSAMSGYVYAEQTSPYALLEIGKAEMEKLLRTMLEGAYTYSAFFMDNSGRVFSDGRVLPKAMWEMVDGILPVYTADGVIQKEFTWEGSRLVLLQDNVGSTNCAIGMLLNESELYLPLQHLHGAYLIYSIGIVLGGLLFLLITYRKILVPVGALREGMTAVGKGQLNVSVPDSGVYEFDLISRQFNRMTVRLNTLIKEAYLSQIKLKNAQLRYLRSQINPHFLQNSLFSIYSMSEAGNMESVSEMALYLGRYYQHSTHLGSNDLALEEEMASIEVYVHIMSLRFPERLRLVTRLEDETKKMHIPALSLQTVVENALLHGMEGCSDACVVTITAQIAGRTLRLEVTDTGSGMNEQQLEEIRERFRHAPEEEDRHGLENVYMRLRLMYGDDVKMEVRQNHPRGTAVEMVIPLQEKANESSDA